MLKCFIKTFSAQNSNGWNISYVAIRTLLTEAWPWHWCSLAMALGLSSCMLFPHTAGIYTCNRRFTLAPVSTPVWTERRMRPDLVLLHSPSSRTIWPFCSVWHLEHDTHVHEHSQTWRCWLPGRATLRRRLKKASVSGDFKHLMAHNPHGPLAAILLSQKLCLSVSYGCGLCLTRYFRAPQEVSMGYEISKLSLQ